MKWRNQAHAPWVTQPGLPPAAGAGEVAPCQRAGRSRHRNEHASEVERRWRGRRGNWLREEEEEGQKGEERQEGEERKKEKGSELQEARN